MCNQVSLIIYARILTISKFNNVCGLHMQASGLLMEQKRTACYDFIEQFCECISKNLSVMQKQRYFVTLEYVLLHSYLQNGYLIKCLNQTFTPLFHLLSLRIWGNTWIWPKFSLQYSECPEECREAVPSLLYAAARFADLPELRDLRTIFTEKYGNSLDSYLNQEVINGWLEIL